MSKHRWAHGKLYHITQASAKDASNIHLDGSARLATKPSEVWFGGGTTCIPFGEGLRHSHRTGIAGPRQRADDDDFGEKEYSGSEEPAGYLGAAAHVQRS